MSSDLILKAARGLLEYRCLRACDQAVVGGVLSAGIITDRQVRMLWNLLGGYRDSLAGMGIDYGSLVPPGDSCEAFIRIRLFRTDISGSRRIVISFPYQEEIIERIKKLKRTPASPPWFDSAQKVWAIPDDLELYEAVLNALGAPGMAVRIEVDPELIREMERAKEVKSRAYEASRATSADIEVPTLLPLYPFQKGGVQWIENLRGQAIVADDMGNGKTAQVLGYLVRHPESLPALVICPATLRANWCKEVVKFTRFKPLLLSSKTSLKPFQKLGMMEVSLSPQPGFEIVVMNYDLLGSETPRAWVKLLVKGDLSVVPELKAAGAYALKMLQKAYDRSSKPEVQARLLDVIRAIELQGERANRRRFVKTTINGIPIQEFIKFGFKTLICDESHYIKDFRAQRTQAVLDLARKIGSTVCLTGTPLLNRPVELYSQISIVNPRIFPKFADFANRYCAPKKNRFGIDYSGASNLDELERILRSEVMIRRTKEEVLPELPPKVRVTIPMIIEKGMDLYRRESKSSLEQLVKIKQEREAWKSLMDSKSDEERRIFLAGHAEEAAAQNRLTSVAIREIEKMKLLAVKAKLPQAVEFIGDAHEQEGKVVVFMVHHESIDQMVESLSGKGLKVGRIDGRVDGPAREPIKDRFQDGDLDILVCGIRAASEGLTLTASHTVVTVEMDWNFCRHLQCEGRVHRLGQKRSPTLYYLVAMGTIEEKIAALIDSKREVVNAAMGEAERTLEEAGILDSLIEDIVNHG